MKHSFFQNLGIDNHLSKTASSPDDRRKTDYLSSVSPIDGDVLAHLPVTSRPEYDHTITKLNSSFAQWRVFPSPKRGEIIRQYGLKLRKHKIDLGRLVSVEMGKSLQEGQGEVQEMIDICDFAVGLSRQLYGKTIASERPQHHMLERWHPLGIVGIISAFNFPVAVWSWNAMIALVCGNVCLWKPSEKTLLCALACQQLLQEVLDENNINYPISAVITGGKEAGQWLAADPNIRLLSATGSATMGRNVASRVGERLGKVLLELSGNNAMIITPSANQELALTAAVFGAVGTAGQRCTSTRRLIIHRSIYKDFTEKLKNAYAQLRIGNPLDKSMHIGPLIDREAVSSYHKTLDAILQQGGQFLVEGGTINPPGLEKGFYVKPVIAEISPEAEVVQNETFAPILYVMKYDTIEEAIRYQNSVNQGLSSAIMTTDVQESERFISVEGSDCGIANVNIGTSGAEIGGAFGGEKETGGGRESGSDAWKTYMRRQTITINFGDSVPLAQGIKFDI
ncbi:aldehyde dehydrogenase family protein [Membranicola marinus]|uniref:aldehyde dehydrogenase (NAD(+)) n=1 Tax=Membranihabitans marinus TaxID=1227546 RepID=A0A953L9C2_9BACT|nr:aldehyde dehydrogenase family protein [Membranihabitans marinus]MBY5957463.1 aldehyde dehydrogenase family protein [Membranihabitans marinus]